MSLRVVPFCGDVVFAGCGSVSFLYTFFAAENYWFEKEVSQFLLFSTRLIKSKQKWPYDYAPVFVLLNKSDDFKTCLPFFLG